MPEHIHIPSDFERLPGYRLLCSALHARAIPTDKIISEAVATHLWMRLWVELTYQARSSSRPGWLGAGRRLYEDSVKNLLPEGDSIKLLIDATVLQEREPEPGQPVDLFCPVFEEGNQDKAGDYVPREKRGQMRSEFTRQERELTQNAKAMASLLPPEKYKRADGSVMTTDEIAAAMLTVQKIDRALGLPVRNPGGYTTGLVVDAGRVGMTYSTDRIKQVCYWLLEARRHPATPKTAEQVLKDWDGTLVMAGMKHKGELNL